MADRQGPLTPEDEGRNRHEAIQELLPWYLNDTLEADERTDVERHLQSCAECRDELEELKGLQFATLLEPETSRESLDEDARERLPNRPSSAPQPSSPSRRPSRSPSEPDRPSFLEWLRGLMRPRRLVAMPAFAVLFIAVGVVLSTQLGLERTIIGDFTGAEQKAYRTTDKYFAFAREVLLDGEFTMRIGGQTKETESFTLERSAETENQLLLTSNIQADELSASQRMQLTSDFQPLSYSLQGPLVYQGSRAEAEFQDNQAIMRVCCRMTPEGQRLNRRIVQLGNEGTPVLYDFSVMSHFALMHQLISSQLSTEEVEPPDLKLTALTPQALRMETMTIQSVEPVTLSSDDQRIPTTRYHLTSGKDDSNLSIYLYEMKDENTLLAAYMPTQPRLASSSSIFIYRSDIYPDGLQLPDARTSRSSP